jgi:hypothetical protein
VKQREMQRERIEQYIGMYEEEIIRRYNAMGDG